MKFTMNRFSIIFLYCLGEFIILRIFDNVMDLGFKLNIRLDLDPHNEYVCFKV